MELVIGGYAQGKLAYVLEKYQLSQVYDETNYEAVLERKEGRIVLNHFHLVIKSLIEKEMSLSDIQKFVSDMVSNNPDMIIISDEIGNGIVPMDKMERYYREETGRLLIELAKNAKRVVRVTCGLAQVLK